MPPWPPARAAWRLYTAVGLPALGRLDSREWAQVGRFLGPSIRGFYERHPLERIVAYWEQAGLREVTVRRMSLGGGVVMSATEGLRRRWARRTERPAFYAVGRGRVGDLLTLLHPPYTLWHLELLRARSRARADPSCRPPAVGARSVRARGGDRRACARRAARPAAADRLSDRALIVLAAVSLAGALAIGVAGHDR